MRKGSPYGPEYQRARARLLAHAPRCHLCGGPGADTADHVPALARHRHVNGSGCCVLRPAHRRCNEHHGRMLAGAAMKRRAALRRAGVRVPAKGTRTWVGANRGRVGRDRRGSWI